MAKSSDQPIEPAAKEKSDISHVRQMRTAESHTLDMIGGCVEIMKTFKEAVDPALDSDAAEVADSLLDTLRVLSDRLNRIVRS
jgi:hypothetical protein